MPRSYPSRRSVRVRGHKRYLPSTPTRSRRRGRYSRMMPYNPYMPYPPVIFGRQGVKGTGPYSRFPRRRRRYRRDEYMVDPRMYRDETMMPYGKYGTQEHYHDGDHLHAHDGDHHHYHYGDHHHYHQGEEKKYHRDDEYYREMYKEPRHDMRPPRDMREMYQEPYHEYDKKKD